MPKQTIPPDLQSQKLVLDSLILEYKNTFERSDKLDNKVYIVITFCGFVFVFITNLFGGLTGLVMPEGTLALLLTVLYVGSCLAVMLAYVLVLVFFLNLLRPERIHRMDPEYMQVERLAVQSEPETIGRLIELYRETVNDSLGRLHDRCDKFSRGLRYVVWTVGLAFLAYIFQILLKLLPSAAGTKKYRRNAPGPAAAYCQSGGIF